MQLMLLLMDTTQVSLIKLIQIKMENLKEILNLKITSSAWIRPLLKKSLVIFKTQTQIKMASSHLPKLMLTI